MELYFHALANVSNEKIIESTKGGRWKPEYALTPEPDGDTKIPRVCDRDNLVVRFAIVSFSSCNEGSRRAPMIYFEMKKKKKKMETRPTPG